MDPTFDTLRDYFTLGVKLVGIINERHMKEFHHPSELGEFDEDTKNRAKKDNEDYLEKTNRVRCGNILYKKVEGTDPDVEVYDIELGRHLEE